MKSIVILTLILFYSVIVYCQPSAQPDLNINVFWDFYSNNRMATINAGKGYTGIAGKNDISGIVLNPASLSVDKKFQIHGEYVYKSDVPWGRTFNPGFGEMNLTATHPSFMLSGAYKITDYLQTGLLWNTANSRRLDMGEFIFTNEFGQEISRVDAYQNMSISTLMLPVVYNYKNKIKAGINFIGLYYHGYLNYITTLKNPGVAQDAKVDVLNFNVQIGFVYSPFKNLSVGGTFTPQVKQLFKWCASDGTTFTNFASNIFPMKLGIGAEYGFSKVPLRVSFDYNYINTSKQDGLKDRNDINIGVEYDFLKQLTIRTGFFTLKDYRQNEANLFYIDPIGKYDEYFLTVGFTYKVKKFSASLALMDSHISTGLIQQTLLNGGITMDF